MAAGCCLTHFSLRPGLSCTLGSSQRALVVQTQPSPNKLEALPCRERPLCCHLPRRRSSVIPIPEQAPETRHASLQDSAGADASFLGKGPETKPAQLPLRFPGEWRVTCLENWLFSHQGTLQCRLMGICTELQTPALSTPPLLPTPGGAQILPARSSPRSHGKHFITYKKLEDLAPHSENGDVGCCTKRHRLL